MIFGLSREVYHSQFGSAEGELLNREAHGGDNNSAAGMPCMLASPRLLHRLHKRCLATVHQPNHRNAGVNLEQNGWGCEYLVSCLSCFRLSSFVLTVAVTLLKSNAALDAKVHAQIQAFC